MRRFVQITHGIVVGVFETSGELPPPEMWTCQCGAWWREDASTISLEAWQSQHAPHGVATRHLILDVTGRETLVAQQSAYDEATGTFTPPPPPPDYGRTVSPREFMQLFTPRQWAQIKNAAKTDEDVDFFVALAQVPEPIRLKHPTTLAGLDLLVAKGLLARADVTRITEG